METLWLNRFGHTRTDVNADMLGGILVNTVLDIGCGNGVNLKLLERDRFTFEDCDGCYGIDANKQALNMAQTIIPKATLIHESIDMTWHPPFRTKQFSVAMFSGTLIHMPQWLATTVLGAACMYANYIYLAEYWSPQEQSVEYRGVSDAMWRRPHARLLADYHGCVIVKQARLRHLDEAERMYTEVALLKCP